MTGRYVAAEHRGLFAQCLCAPAAPDSRVGYVSDLPCPKWQKFAYCHLGQDLLPDAFLRGFRSWLAWRDGRRINH